jgi:hypothetical protein
MQVLAIKHGPNTGFFSNCSVRLHWIVRYLNKNKNLPDEVCSKNQFALYKDDAEADVAKLLFLDRDEIQVVYRHRFDYVHAKQFINYKLLAFRDLRPLLEKYFTVSPVVAERERALSEQYGLDFKHTIGVLYRGNDKVSETRVAPYALFFEKARELLAAHPEARFLVQTDELEFRNEFCARFPNSIYFESLPPIPKDATRAITPPAGNRIGFAIEILAAIKCLARTEHLITGSGNVDIWTVFFRGHTEGLHQFLEDRFIDRDNVLLGYLAMKGQRYFGKIGWVYRWIGRRYFGFKPQ